MFPTGRMVAIALALALAGCSGDDTPQATSPAATPTPSATAPMSAADAEAAEEKRILDQAWAQSVASDKAEAARVKEAVGGLTTAMDLFGADPIPTIRGRLEACLDGDKLKFLSFYSPANAESLSRNQQILDFEFEHECPNLPAGGPRPDIGALLEGVQVFAKRSEKTDRVTGETIYKLCLSDKGPERCVQTGSWEQSVQVLGGRVFYIVD